MLNSGSILTKFNGFFDPSFELSVIGAVSLSWKEEKRNNIEIERKEKEEREKEEKGDEKERKKKAMHSFEEEDSEEERIEPMPGMKFAQKIGPLLNPDLSAASCELLELLIIPLVTHEESLTDDEIDHYFTCVNTIFSDVMEIIKAAVGERDKSRKELKCLFSFS